MGAALSFHITKIKVFQVQKLAENTFTLIKYLYIFLFSPNYLFLFQQRHFQNISTHPRSELPFYFPFQIIFNKFINLEVITGIIFVLKNYCKGFDKSSGSSKHEVSPPTMISVVLVGRQCFHSGSHWSAAIPYHKMCKMTITFPLQNNHLQIT